MSHNSKQRRTEGQRGRLNQRKMVIRGFEWLTWAGGVREALRGEVMVWVVSRKVSKCHFFCTQFLEFPETGGQAGMCGGDIILGWWSTEWR